MIDGKAVLAVVPARGGSKGVPLKNLHPLNGKPLLAHTGDLLRQLPLVDRAVVSTDHEQIAAIAEANGIAAPFRRPLELSGDLIGDTDVLIHSLQEMERIDGRRYDVVVMLQPTCPLRRPEHVRDAVVLLASGGWDSVWTVSPTDVKYHPLKQLAIHADGSMTLSDPRGSGIVARQQLQPTFTRNGAAYAMCRTCLLEQRTTLGSRSAAVVIDEPMVSIDTLDDFAKVEAAMSKRAKTSSHD